MPASVRPYIRYAEFVGAVRDLATGGECRFYPFDWKTLSVATEAASARGTGKWAREWEELFLPSADLYMASCPEDRAGLLVSGRGAS
jgi:hypothetical protein